MTSLADLYQRSRAGDLDAIPVQQEDPSTWWDRVKAAWASGGWQDPQPGQRGTFVPGQVGQDGKISPAVPGIIQQPAEGLQVLMTAPLSDIVRSGDRDAIRAASEASFDVASMLPAAGVAAGRTIPEGAAGIFGGRLAKTADQAALKRAEDMAAKGAPREQIWQDTGWFKGVDGKWRFEIDDSKSAIKYPAGDVAGEVAKVMGVHGDMGDIFSHPQAYSAYPDVASIPGDIGLFRRGTYYREPGIGGEMISVSAKDADRVPHTLHEFQHAIQNREKFARGGNPAGLREQLQGSVPDNWLRNDVLNEAYKRLSGEVESRAVETRADLTPDQRRARPPWLDYDVPENQQIVKFSANPDDPNTAAILSALTAQEQPRQAAPIGSVSGNTIYRKSNDAGDRVEYIIRTPDGARVSSAVRVGDRISRVSTEPDYRRQGFASALYDAIESDMGGKLKPSGDYLSQEIKDLWKKRLGETEYNKFKEQGLFANPDDPGTAAILAILAAQQGGQQNQ